MIYALLLNDDNNECEALAICHENTSERRPLESNTSLRVNMPSNPLKNESKMGRFKFSPRTGVMPKRKSMVERIIENDKNIDRPEEARNNPHSNFSTPRRKSLSNVDPQQRSDTHSGISRHTIRATLTPNSSPLAPRGLALPNFSPMLNSFRVRFKNSISSGEVEGTNETANNWKTQGTEILILRDVNEVIPRFDSFHANLKGHLLRRGVKVAFLKHDIVDEPFSYQPYMNELSFREEKMDCEELRPLTQRRSTAEDIFEYRSQSSPETLDFKSIIKEKEIVPQWEVMTRELYVPANSESLNPNTSLPDTFSDKVVSDDCRKVSAAGGRTFVLNLLNSIRTIDDACSNSSCSSFSSTRESGMLFHHVNESKEYIEIEKINDCSDKINLLEDADSKFMYDFNKLEPQLMNDDKQFSTPKLNEDEKLSLQIPVLERSEKDNLDLQRSKFASSLKGCEQLNISEVPSFDHEDDLLDFNLSQSFSNIFPASPNSSPLRGSILFSDENSLDLGKEYSTLLIHSKSTEGFSTSPDTCSTENDRMQSSLGSQSKDILSLGCESASSPLVGNINNMTPFSHAERCERLQNIERIKSFYGDDNVLNERESLDKGFSYGEDESDTNTFLSIETMSDLSSVGNINVDQNSRDYTLWHFVDDDDPILQSRIDSSNCSLGSDTSVDVSDTSDILQQVFSAFSEGISNSGTVKTRCNGDYGDDRRKQYNYCLSRNDSNSEAGFFNPTGNFVTTSHSEDLWNHTRYQMQPDSIGSASTLLSPLEQMDHYISSRILAHLDVLSIYNVSLTSRTMLQASEADALWKIMFRNRWNAWTEQIYSDFVDRSLFLPKRSSTSIWKRFYKKYSSTAKSENIKKIEYGHNTSNNNVVVTNEPNDDIKETMALAPLLISELDIKKSVSEEKHIVSSSVPLKSIDCSPSAVSMCSHGTEIEDHDDIFVGKIDFFPDILKDDFRRKSTMEFSQNSLSSSLSDEAVDFLDAFGKDGTFSALHDQNRKSGFVRMNIRSFDRDMYENDVTLREEMSKTNIINIQNVEHDDIVFVSNYMYCSKEGVSENNAPLYSFDDELNILTNDSETYQNVFCGISFPGQCMTVNDSHGCSALSSILNIVYGNENCVPDDYGIDEGVSINGDYSSPHNSSWVDNVMKIFMSSGRRKKHYSNFVAPALKLKKRSNSFQAIRDNFLIKDPDESISFN